MKKSFGAKATLFPLPVVLIGTYAEDGEANLMTASWAGVVNSIPPMLSVSVRKSRATYQGMELNREFTISFPNSSQVKEADFCGVVSHKTTNKPEALGLKHKKSELVNAPEFEVFPAVAHCKLAKSMDCGSHIVYLGEILDLCVEEFALTDDMPDLKKVDPIMYNNFTRSYYSLGEKIADAYKMNVDTYKK